MIVNVLIRGTLEYLPMCMAQGYNSNVYNVEMGVGYSEICLRANVLPQNIPKQRA